MSNYTTHRNRICFSLQEDFKKSEFDDIALDIFLFQYTYNKVYRRYCQLIKRTPDEISIASDIPFLPIQFFKSHTIKTGDWKEEAVFQSSGTTGQTRSRHFIRSLRHYLDNCIKGFKEYFDDPGAFCFLAILPGYSDRPDSSLIYMLSEFVRISKYQDSGFYLGKEKELLDVLHSNKERGIPTVLFGVSFALLDLCAYDIDFPDLILIETGGMKTSNIELSKEEILEQFQSSWNLNYLASEYGMTELLSQSYAKGSLWYHPAKTKKVVIGSLSDPFQNEVNLKTGIIKVVDLSNFDTCSFVETQDLGILRSDGAFQVLGRMDNSELRGCNLLLDQTLKNPIS